MGLFSGISIRATAGFACQQGFLYALFYLGENRSVDVAGLSFERFDLLLTFAFMALAFAVVRIASARARDALLAPTLVGWYAVLLVIGSLLVVLPLDAGAAEVAAEGALVGVPSGLLMCAWGRTLVGCSRFGGAREVLLATALGAAVGLAASVVPIAGAPELLKLLPVGSAWGLRSLASGAARCREGSDAAVRGAAEPRTAAGAREGVPSAAAEPEEAAAAPGGALSLSSLLASSDERETARLSARVTAGTALFGLAGGFMEVFSSEPGMAAVPTFSVTLLILVLFCVAAVQLLAAAAPWGSRASDDPEAEGSLAGVYRLAILLTMAGYLFVPVLGGFGITGQAIVLAGYLGLTCVLMTMFLAIARASSQDAATSFARGLFALFVGEAAGIVLGNAIELIQPGVAQPLASAACAGLAFLFAYLFLFTERDYVELTAIAGEVDVFDEACARIAEDCGLSKREAEVLPLALRGRTAERIAGELCVAKSTADTHLRRIYAKTGVHSRQELIDLGERVQKSLLSR